MTRLLGIDLGERRIGLALADGDGSGAQPLATIRRGSSLDAESRNFIARLDASTGAVDSFNPNANDSIVAIVVQSDGKILVGGNFYGPKSIGGQRRNFIARLDPATGLADSFDPNARGFTLSIALQADGKILAGGVFSGANSIGGQLRNGIARLDATTGAADSFDPNANSQVNAIAVQTDGKILAGGFFTNIGGQTRNLFARLNNDTTAWQNLAVTPNVVTWTRDGSSPQFARVTFEYSTDNVSYTPLGNGTASGSNWTLTDLSLQPDRTSTSARAAIIAAANTMARRASPNRCGMLLSHRPHADGGRLPKDPRRRGNLSTSTCRSRVTPASNAAAVERPMITRLSLPSPAQLLSLTQRSLRALDQSAAAAAAGRLLLLLTSLV